MADNHDHEDDEGSVSSCITFSTLEYCPPPDNLRVLCGDNGAKGKPFDKVRSNDPTVQRLSFHLSDPVPSTAKGKEFGRSIAGNTHLKTLYIRSGYFHEEEKVESSDYVRALFRRMAQNRSLERILLEDFDFEYHNFRAFIPIVALNSNLTRLELWRCGLQPRHIEMLSDAIRRTGLPLPLKSMCLIGRKITNESVGPIVDVCNSCPHLETLNLSYCGIGDRGCRVLAELLERRDSKLKCLQLNMNPIHNEGARILASSAANNRTLSHLFLESGRVDSHRLPVGWAVYRSRERITASGGWDTFLGILRGVDIDSTYQSNHVLYRLWKHIPSPEDMDLPDGLRFCLEANREVDKAVSARKKIIYFHLSGNFDLSPFLSMDAGLVPDVLGWIGKDCDCDTYGDILLSNRSTAFYRILRRFPDLCNFRSQSQRTGLKLEAQRMRLDGTSCEQQDSEAETVKNELRAEDASGASKQSCDHLVVGSGESKPAKRAKCEV